MPLTESCWLVVRNLRDGCIGVGIFNIDQEGRGGSLVKSEGGGTGRGCSPRKGIPARGLGRNEARILP
jgi:hypothetical protein